MKQLLLIILLLNFNLSNSQSLKKIFKEITNENYEKAYKELSKINTDEKYSPQDAILLQLANCILLSNESYIAYNPYESNDLFIALKEKASVEVNEFLNKYELSLFKIEDNILKAIFNDAKTKNTVEAIGKAISYCKSCQYINELRELKLVSEYNSAKKTGTIEAYEIFLKNYINSNYSKEITDLLCEKAFDFAVNKNSVESLNDYLKNYSFCPLQKPYAIEMRDSIAYKMIDISYKSKLNYTKQYPNSKYTSEIIQDLPNILYSESIDKNSISLMSQFVKEFPNDFRVNAIKHKIELLYYNNLKNKFSVREFNEFKSEYPNSIYLNDLKNKYENLVANNSLKREGVKGNVKSIYMIEEQGKIYREYNEFGNVISTSVSQNESYSYVYDIIEDSKLFIAPINYDDELIYNKGVSELQYYYDYTGKLISVSNIGFKYDSEGNLIEKIWGDIVIKYKWLNGKLISKNIYKGNGDIYFCYTIDYHENNKTVKEFEGHHRYDEPDKIYSVQFNNQGKISSLKLVSFANYSNAWGKDEWHDYTNYYEYKNDLLISITTDKKMATPIPANNYKKYVTSKQIFHYDKHNNIVYIEKDLYGNNIFEHEVEYKYEYDLMDNWIKRTEYAVKIADIKISTKKREINREITYY